MDLRTQLMFKRETVVLVLQNNNYNYSPMSMVPFQDFISIVMKCTLRSYIS